MANKPIIPIPRDPIGESFVWRDWFQKLSNTVYGTIATQDANNVNITGGTISNINFTGVTITKSTIDSTPIGNNSASTGRFTSIKLDTALAVAYGGTGVKTSAANYVFAGPTTGAAAAPSFRALVAADIPALTSGSSILYGNGTGGFSNVTIGTGVSFVAGTLSATGSGGDVVGPASSTDNAVARFNLTTGKLIQNSGVIIDDTNNISGVLSQQFSDGTAVTLAAGKMWYNGTTGSWNMGMGNGNITQQVGEEQFIYGKASAAITDSPLQIVYHTGTVGASGVVTFAPTIVGITDINAIVGIATESIALNGFGRITSFGVVRGITTNGTAYGETWADDDVIWYNPVTGNPTKVEPVAPNIKIQVGIVINAGSGGSGSFQVLLRPGSKLGGTDSNVQFGTLANNDLIQYSTSLGYWTNVTPASVLAAASGAPITKTANFTVGSGETWFINNKSGSTCVVTLPTASSWTGRTLTFKNMQAQLLNSATSNVVPIDSTTAGTAILLGVVGNWATLVSDGTNWVIMQAASNNCLLLE